MKKIRLVTILILLCLSLSSCDIARFDTDTLLTPPQMNVANQQIQKALAAAVGDSFSLVYPKTGDYQNAIISIDLTGDGENEALCFYTTGQDKKVSFTVLERIKGEWKAQSMSHSQSAAAIDVVNFFDYDADGTREIIIGWQYLQGDEKALEVYNYGDSAKIESLYTGMYSNIIVFDKTLVTLSRNTTGKTASATLVGKQGKSVGVMGTASLNNSVSAILTVATARVGDNDVIYIDEQLESMHFTTELLTVNEKNDISNVTSAYGAISTRNSPIVATDVNSDGIPDIPLERAFPSYTVGDKTETLYYIEWYNVKDTSKIMNAYTSSNEKFILQLDDAWTDKITVQKDKASDRQIHFYQLAEDGNIPMFSVRVFSHQEFSDDIKNQGWISVAEQGENVYAYRERVAEGLSEEFKVDITKFKKLFKLLD